MSNPTIREMKRRKEELAATVRCLTIWTGTLALRPNFQHPILKSDSCDRHVPVFPPHLYPKESQDQQSKCQQASKDMRVRPSIVDAGPLQRQH